MEDELEDELDVEEVLYQAVLSFTKNFRVQDW